MPSPAALAPQLDSGRPAVAYALDPCCYGILFILLLQVMKEHHLVTEPIAHDAIFAHFSLRKVLKCKKPNESC